MRFFLFLCLLTSLSATTQPIRLGIRHIENKGIGYHTGYTTFEGFFGVNGDRYVPFIDVRGHLFDNGNWAANAGVGFRALWGCRTYGFNAYYDWRNSKRNYQQAGVGLEFLGSVWDFRVNGYLPFGGKRKGFGTPRFDHFQDHYMFICQKTEFAMAGANAEFGGHINSVENFDFFIGGGPYYFQKRIGGDNAIGGEARFLAKYKDYVSLQVSGSYDPVFHGIVQGEVGFSIPFGPCKNREPACCCNFRDRMVEPVYRDEIIVLNTRCKSSIAIDPATGNPYFFWFVNNTSSSSGTFESPFPTLLLAQNASHVNDVIYVFPGDGTTRGMDAGFTLKNNQRFFGASIDQNLLTTLGGVTIPPQASIMPTITNAADVIVLASHNTVSGIHAFQTTSNIISGVGIEGATIINNILESNGNIMANDHAGITLGSDSSVPVSIFGDVLISGNTITGNSEQFFGLRIFPQNSEVLNISIVGNTVDSLDDGMKMTPDDNSQVYLQMVENSFHSQSKRGFDLEPMSSSFVEYTLSGNRFSSPDRALNIVARDTSRSIGTIIGNTFFNSNHGFSFAGGGNGYRMTASIEDNLFSNNGSDDFTCTLDAGKPGIMCVGLQGNIAPSFGYQFQNNDAAGVLNIRSFVNNIGPETESGVGPITHSPTCP